MFKSPDYDREGDNQGSELEQAHVYSVYDQIAPCFAEISQKAWPNVRKFLKNKPPGALVADIGCGSGRYLHINKNTFKIGLDICCPLVDSARTKGYEVLVADNLKLPFRDEIFDVVISIGVVHHFSTNERRIEALQELARILQQGGQLMIYVWAYEQKHRRFDGQDVLVPWHGEHKPSKYSATGSSLRASSSDKDVSSISSVSEDESSADSTFSTHVLERTTSEYFKDKDADDVFIEDFDACQKLTCDSRKRSNTLPCALEGCNLCAKRTHGAKLLAEECRKIEASLKEMSAKHHKSEMVEDVGMLKSRHSASFSLHYVSSDNLNSSQTSKFLQPYNSGISKSSSEKCYKDFTFSQNLIENGAPDDCFSSCQNSLTDDLHTHQKSSQSKCSDHSHDVIHSEDSEAGVIKKSPSSFDFEFPIQVFEFLKTKLKSLIDSKPKHEEKKVQADDDCLTMDAVGNDMLTINTSDQFSLVDGIEEFAVREFPMSSCPVYRKEMKDIVKDSGSQSVVTNGDHHTDDREDKTVKHYGGKMLSDGVFVDTEYTVTNSSNMQHICQKSKKLRKRSSKEKAVSSKCTNVVETIAQSFNHHEEKQMLTNGYHENKPTESKYYNDSCVNGSNSFQQPNKHHNESDDSVDRSRSRSFEYNPENQECALNGLCNSAVSGKVSGAPRKKNGSHKNISKHLDRSHSDTSEKNLKSQSFSLSSSNGASDLSHFTSSELDYFPRHNLSDKSNTELCRYYHVFKEGELTNLIKNHVKCLRIVSCILDHGNWCVVTEKL